MSEKKFDIFRLSMGQKRFESGPHKWTVAWRKAAKLNAEARRAFKEGRILYDVPEYVTEERAGARDPGHPNLSGKERLLLMGLAKGPIYARAIYPWDETPSKVPHDRTMHSLVQKGFAVANSTTARIPKFEITSAGRQVSEEMDREWAARLTKAYSARGRDVSARRRTTSRELRVKLKLPGVRDPGMETKKDGKRYALEYIQGDYFMDFVREQMQVAHEHPETHWQIKTKPDAVRAARNTFQQLTWDMGRDISAPKAFWEGVREALSMKSTMSWLADELLLLAKELKGTRR